MEMKRLNASGLKAAGYDERNRTLVVETTTSIPTSPPRCTGAS
jgi:hypothetical protein